MLNFFIFDVVMNIMIFKDFNITIFQIFSTENTIFRYLIPTFLKRNNKSLYNKRLEEIKEEVDENGYPICLKDEVFIIKV